MPNHTNLVSHMFPVAGLSMGLIIGVGLAFYIAISIPYFFLYKKAGIKTAWLAFIPVAQLVPFFRVIHKSPWNILWAFLPFLSYIFIFGEGGTKGLIVGGIVGIATGITLLVLEIIWFVKFFKAYNMSPWWLLLMIGIAIPIINLMAELGFIAVFYIMAFGDGHDYQYGIA